MKSKVVLVAFLLMLYITPMILGPSYTAPSIDDESNFTLSSGENWLSGWTYRRSHTINGSSGAGTKYPVRIETYYNALFSLTYNISWADKAHQGVTTDGTYVYTTNSSSLSKYQKDGTFILSRVCSGDGTYSAIGDLCYYDGFLYVVGHDGGHPAHGTAMNYTASDLSYNGEYAIQDFASENSGSANIAYGNDSFWTQSDWIAPDTSFEVQRYDLSWSYQENWIVEAFSMSGDYRYNGFDWIDENYFITVSHEATDPNKIDFYYFNGTTFSKHIQLDRPEWTGEDSSTYEACQGLAVEIDGGTTYVWFASRNNTAVTQEGEVARYVLSADSENYQIYLEQNCQTDFGDIRFTDDDGNTELDYWMEDYTSSYYATFWVNVTDDLDSDVEIYTYYGTSGTSSTTSNGTDTFLFYEDWESESIRDSLWDILNTDGSASWSSTDATHGTVLRLQGNAGVNRYQFISDAANGYSWPASISFRMRSHLEEAVAESQVVQVGSQHQGGSARLQLKAYQGTYSAVFIADDDANEDTTSLAHNYWDAYYIYEVARNGTYVRFWVDNDFIGEADNSPDANNHILNFYCRDEEKDIYNDWIIVRKYIHDEPAHYTWGEEEIYSPPEWTQISSIRLLFQAPISEFAFWSFNVIMIFAGLIMMPVSALYLVRGGRKDLDSDKVFYAIVAFIMGWALFLGGIMP